MTTTSQLRSTEGPVLDGYDLVLVDLDGVVYLGDQVIPGAAEALTAVRRGGVNVEFVTNNASRSGDEVAGALRALGVSADATEVATSAQAAAAVLADRYPKGSTVLVVGAPALVREVSAVGLRPTTAAADKPVAVVQGYAPEVGWGQLAEATVAVRAGADWVVTNRDRTLPSPRGPLPGNGSLVAVLVTALGREPDVAVGKPEPALFTDAIKKRGGQRALVVGDRLDTDIEGANNTGLDSLLVLTGVSTAADLLVAPPERRPRYLGHDLGALLVPHPEPVLDGTQARCGGWTARRTTADSVDLDGAGDAIDALRALCLACWSYRGSAPDGQLDVRAGSAAAGDACRELGLAGRLD